MKFVKPQRTCEVTGSHIFEYKYYRLVESDAV
jgi:hypothetical protein